MERETLEKSKSPALLFLLREVWILRRSPAHGNEADRIIMAAVLREGMLSHREQTMASDDYPEWLTAEHRTGVRKVFYLLTEDIFCMNKI